MRVLGSSFLNQRRQEGLRPKLPELVWDGKYDKDGRRAAPLRVALPFQTVETVNESAQERQRSLNLFDSGRDPAWRNRLIWGDKKYVLPALLDEFAGKVDLIYIDPPFATGADFSFNTVIPADPELDQDEISFTKQPSVIEQKAYRDTWGRGLDSYLSWFADAAIPLCELLTNDGSMYVHCDTRVNSALRLLLDEVFGPGRLQSEVIFKRRHGHSDAATMGNIHDTLLLYTKSDSFTWNPQYVPYTDDYVKTYYRYSDPDGRKWLSRSTTAPGGRGPVYVWKGIKRAWRYTEEQMSKLDREGRLFYTKNGMPRYKQYLDEMPGLPLSTLWTDVKFIDSWSSEDVGYPTQKPESLLERIISGSSNEGDLVLDCFCGSGTTAVVAEKLGRCWITADLGRFAIHTTRKRLLSTRDVKPFVVQNLGKYERQLWQAAEFGESAEARTTSYRRFILDLYKAQTIEGYAWLHGLKQGRMVHVGTVDAPVTVGDVKQIATEFRKVIGTGKDAPTAMTVDVLGWDFAFELNEVARQEAAKAGIEMRFVRIPREVLDKRAVEQGDIAFFELAALAVDIKHESRRVAVALTDFVIPLDDVPAEIQSAITSWTQWIDYWAVDWDNKGDTFHNQWQSYRTRKKNDIDMTASYDYDEPGTYTVVIKVIDILGNDTTKTVSVTIPGRAP